MDQSTALTFLAAPARGGGEGSPWIALVAGIVAALTLLAIYAARRKRGDD